MVSKGNHIPPKDETRGSRKITETGQRRAGGFMTKEERETHVKVDKNDQLNYIGGDYGFTENEGYLNNIRTKVHQKPRSYPWDDWKQLIGGDFHRTAWVPRDRRNDDSRARRRLHRDPNHAIWESRYGLLRWWRMRVTILGSDTSGRQVIQIRQGKGEPVYIRAGRILEVYYKGKRVNLLDAEETEE